MEKAIFLSELSFQLLSITLVDDHGFNTFVSAQLYAELYAEVYCRGNSISQTLIQ
jgi:hypothetical protein